MESAIHIYTSPLQNPGVPHPTCTLKGFCPLGEEYISGPSLDGKKSLPTIFISGERYNYTPLSNLFTSIAAARIPRY